MIKKMFLVIFLLIFLLLALNYSNTGLAFYSQSFSLSLFLGFFFSVVLLFLIFRRRERKILEKTGIKEQVEKNEIVQKYSLTSYVEKLRKSIDYVSKIYNNMKDRLNSLEYLESEEMKQLEEKSKIVEEILDSLYDALENLKKGKEYNSVSSVEYALGIAQDLAYSGLTENLQALATKMREAYTLKSIKLRELKK